MAETVHNQYRTAEGRNVFGGYGQRGLTPAMRRVATQLDTGQLAPETDQFALLDGDMFRRQLADRYTGGTWQVHRLLKSQGFELAERQNGWALDGQHAIRTRWHDPAHDLPFEVQFHTPASWDAQRRGHAAELPAPADSADIGDYRREEPPG